MAHTVEDRTWSMKTGRVTEYPSMFGDLETALLDTRERALFMLKQCRRDDNVAMLRRVVEGIDRVARRYSLDRAAAHHIGK